MSFRIKCVRLSTYIVETLLLSLSQGTFFHLFILMCLCYTRTRLERCVPTYMIHLHIDTIKRLVLGFCGKIACAKDLITTSDLKQRFF